jgi:hypothetical protein
MAANRRHLGIVAAALLAACAGARPAAVPPLAWPPAPAAPHVRLTGMASGLGDLGLTRPWYARAWDFVTGADVAESFGMPFAVALRGPWLALGDAESGAVWLINRDDAAHTVIDRVGGDLLTAPVGLALGASGLWISDAELGEVAEVSYDGDLLRKLTGLSRPAGLALDARGRLAVAQPAAHKVTVFDADGTRHELGKNGAGPGEFNFPTAVAFGADGSLWVNDALNFRVQRFDAALAHVASFGQRGDAPGFFARARGLAVAGDGAVYVADALFDVVQVFDPQGGLLLVVGGDGHGPGEFWMPGGLAVDGRRLVVADTENKRLQFFELTEAAP